MNYSPYGDNSAVLGSRLFLFFFWSFGLRCLSFYFLFLRYGFLWQNVDLFAGDYFFGQEEIMNGRGGLYAFAHPVQNPLLVDLGAVFDPEIMVAQHFQKLAAFGAVFGLGQNQSKGLFLVASGAL